MQIDQVAKVRQTVVPTFNANVSTLLVPAASDRMGIWIWNNSGNSIYLSLVSPANSSQCLEIVATFQPWRMMGPLIWTGGIWGIRNSGTGGVTVWEFLK